MIFLRRLLLPVVLHSGFFSIIFSALDAYLSWVLLTSPFPSHP